MLKAAGGGGGGGVATSLVVGTTAVTGGAAYAVLREDGSQNLAASTALTFGSAAAGTGLAIVAGTAVTDVNALSITQTWNNSAVTTGVKISITDTTSNAAANLIQVFGGGAGTTNYMSLSKSGVLWATGGIALGGQATKPSVQATTTGLSLYNGNFNAVNGSITMGATTGIEFRQNSTGLLSFTGSADGSAVATSGLSQTASGEISFGTGAQGSAAGTCRAAAYKVGATAGASFGPGVVTSLTVVNGIVTAVS